MECPQFGLVGIPMGRQSAAIGNLQRKHRRHRSKAGRLCDLSVGSDGAYDGAGSGDTWLSVAIPAGLERSAERGTRGGDGGPK